MADWVDESDPACLGSIVEDFDSRGVGCFGGISVDVHICPLWLDENPPNLDMAEGDGGFG